MCRGIFDRGGGSLFQDSSIYKYSVGLLTALFGSSLKLRCRRKTANSNNGGATRLPATPDVHMHMGHRLRNSLVSQCASRRLHPLRTWGCICQDEVSWLALPRRSSWHPGVIPESHRADRRMLLNDNRVCVRPTTTSRGTERHLNPPLLCSAQIYHPGARNRNFVICLLVVYPW